MVKLAESSKRIELIREKIAAFNNKVITRFGCAHTLSDLMDMIDNMNLSDEAIVKRIEFLKEKITVEMKVIHERMGLPWTNGPMFSSRAAQKTWPRSTAQVWPTKSTWQKSSRKSWT